MPVTVLLRHPAVTPFSVPSLAFGPVATSAALNSFASHSLAPISTIRFRV